MSNNKADVQYYRSRRPRRVMLLSAKNKKLRIQVIKLDSRRLENFVWSDEPKFLLQMVGLEFGIKNMKPWIHSALCQQFRLVLLV